MELLEKEKWNLVILDINMPGKSGLEALKDIKLLYPNLPVLILSMFSEDQYGIRAIKAGASGYLKKENSHSCYRLRLHCKLHDTTRFPGGNPKKIGERERASRGLLK